MLMQQCANMFIYQGKSSVEKTNFSLSRLSWFQLQLRGGPEGPPRRTRVNQSPRRSVCVCVWSPVTGLKVTDGTYQRKLGNSPGTTQEPPRNHPGEQSLHCCLPLEGDEEACLYGSIYVSNTHTHTPKCKIRKAGREPVTHDASVSERVVSTRLLLQLRSAERKRSGRICILAVFPLLCFSGNNRSKNECKRGERRTKINRGRL